MSGIIRRRDGFGTVVRNLSKGDAVFLHLGDNLFGTVAILNTSKGRTRVAFQFHKSVSINQKETPCREVRSQEGTKGSSRPCSPSSHCSAAEPSQPPSLERSNEPE
jgi:hypothetical protein